MKKVFFSLITMLVSATFIHAQYGGGDAITIYGRNNGTTIDHRINADGSQTINITIDCDNFFDRQICYVISNKPMTHPGQNQHSTYAEITAISEDGEETHVEGELINSQVIEFATKSHYEFTLVEL